MKTSIAILASMVCSVALSADRISMVDNSSEMSVRDAVVTAAQAFSAKDSAGFSMCFKESRRDHIRKKCAFSFLEEDATMEILNVHVFSIDEDSASAAVKYRMVSAGNSKDVVSEVVMEREGERWVISRETVRSSKDSAPPQYSLPSSGPRQKNQGNQVDLNSQRPEWDNFNPNANGISPNLQHLIGDIGVRPGMGCANGRCKR